MWVRSRRAPVDHTNVNDAWDTDASKLSETLATSPARI